VGSTFYIIIQVLYYILVYIYNQHIYNAEFFFPDIKIDNFGGNRGEGIYNLQWNYCVGHMHNLQI